MRNDTSWMLATVCLWAYSKFKTSLLPFQVMLIFSTPRIEGPWSCPPEVPPLVSLSEQGKNILAHALTWASNQPPGLLSCKIGAQCMSRGILLPQGVWKWPFANFAIGGRHKLLFDQLLSLTYFLTHVLPLCCLTVFKESVCSSGWHTLILTVYRKCIRCPPLLN